MAGADGFAVAEHGPRVSAVVVNYNAGAILTDCVQAVLAGPGRVRVTVIDNRSSDNSMERLADELGSHQRLGVRRNDSNLGFARAVNDFARTDDSDFLLVINPDCVLYDHALEQLVAALDDQPTAALAGPMIHDGSGRLESACFRYFPRPWNSLVTFTGLWRLGRWIPGLRGIRPLDVEDMQAVVDAEATSGACMLLRLDAFRRVGCFDEGYGMHCEDLDLMYRLQHEGWRCLFVPGARATHEQGVSSRSRPFWVHQQKHRGMWRFYRKLLSRDYASPVTALVALGIATRYFILLPLIWLKK